MGGVTSARGCLKTNKKTAFFVFRKNQFD